jgi:hypothetical protein
MSDPTCPLLLRAIIARGWSADTSDSFHPCTPSKGQCAVTALVVQDWLGGDLLRAPYCDGDEKGSHYWNRLPSGEEVDITRDQFKSPLFGSAEVRTRDYLLSNVNTRARYIALKEGIVGLRGRVAP